MRSYERAGGLEGLEAGYVETRIDGAAHLSGLTHDQVRKLLLAMVEPTVGNKTRTRTMAQLVEEIA